MSRWAASVTDQQWHAVETGAAHPPGLYEALCGHVLTAALASLSDSCRNPCARCFEVLARRTVARG